jgi:hypothetical protein
LFLQANLVIKYNTTFEDAVAGRSPKNGELSLRIRRNVAATTKDDLHEGLMALAKSCQVFRDLGWDGKTPAVDPSQAAAPAGETAAALSDDVDDDDDVEFDDEGFRGLGVDVPVNAQQEGGHHETEEGVATY